jgi:hypothetical protein
MNCKHAMPARCLAAALLLAPVGAFAQSPANMVALRGLAPFAVLLATPQGRLALETNYTVTGSIQSGALTQPTLLPFAAQQGQALKDAFITGGNASELADGLGTRLGPIYQSLARYEGTTSFTSVSPAIANLIAYTNETTGSDSNTAKYFFANGSLNGKAPVSEQAAAILSTTGGATDVLGRAYGHPAGSPGADPFGDSRPFQTEPELTPITGPDYFGAASSNVAYLRGPLQDLTDSPSFPSGHTTYGYMESMLLAILVPERYEQQITRAAEYGNDRIILGAHYAVDVIGGRTLALHDVAHLLANDPNFVGQPKRRTAVITDYPAALAVARTELRAALQSGCGDTIPVCAASDTGRFSDPAANQRFYDVTQTYGLPVVYPDTANRVEDIGKVAPEAGYLLTAAFPFLTLEQADGILTATEGPGGGFLDDGSAFGMYSRLNLYAAGKQAGSLARSR